MIDALIAGRMHGCAEARTGQSGSDFVTCKVRATAGNGDSIFCNVIAFNDDARHALLALDDGDSVALSGALTPKVWTDKRGNAHPALDLVAHGVLTAYHVSRKRRAAQGEAKSDQHGCGATFADDSF
jgi:single-stranded DNA-binding protein